MFIFTHHSCILFYRVSITSFLLRLSIFFIWIFCGRPKSDSISGDSDIPRLKEGHSDALDHDTKMKYNSERVVDHGEKGRDRGTEEGESMEDGRDTARSRGKEGSRDRDRDRDGRENRNKNSGRRNEKQKLDNEEWTVPPRQVRH